MSVFVNVHLKFVGSSHWAPEFLEPVILEVVLAGKSMEMLQDLGKLADVCGGKQWNLLIELCQTSGLLYIYVFNGMQNLTLYIKFCTGI